MRLPDPCARILAWCARRPLRAAASAQRLLERTPLHSPTHPWAQFTLGWCMLVREQPAAAIALLQQAHDQLRAQGEPWAPLRARHGILLAMLLQGVCAADLAGWETLAAACVAHALPLEAASVRVGQMRALNMLGRSTDALAVGLVAQPVIATLGDPADQAGLARTTGTAHLQLGNFPEASAALALAVAGFRQLRMPGELARTWFEQARLALTQDAFAAALALQERTHAAFVRLNMPLRAAICVKNFGLITAKLGQTDRAIAHLLAARQALTDLNQPYQVADCTLNLGVVAFYSGLYELALAAWRQVESQYAALGMRGMTLVSRRNQAEAHYHLQQLDAAEALLTALLEEAEQLDARRDYAEILQTLGEVVAARGKSTVALTYLRQAEAQFTALPNRPGAGRARLAQGWLQLAHGELDSAEASFQHAAAVLVEAQRYHWRAVYGLGRCAEQRGDPATALAHYQQASTSVAALRHGVAEAHASSALFREAQPLTTAAVRLAAAQNNPLLVLQLAEQQRALALQQQLQREPIILPPAMHAEYERCRAHLRALAAQEDAGPALATALTAYLEVLLHGRHATMPDAVVPTQALELDALRECLAARYGTDWTALVYVQTDEALLAITLGPTQMQLTSIPFDQALRRRLERACLPRYRAYTYQDLPFQTGQQSTPWADLAALGAALIPPAVRERLHPAQRLLIVPAGPLHQLPWAALRVQAQWLVEQTVIQLIPSLQIWAELVQRPQRGRDALLIGVSQFGGRAESLPSAIPSLDLAQRHWAGEVTRLEDAEVTREKLRSAAATGALQHYGLIHLATHGQLLGGHGMLAHLKLADDDLLADEVAQLRLGGCLVLLVACEGARGETLPGEEVLSLSWALLAAGARDVVASL
ncbi:MAG: CHAT domain-containing protein, partial [Chloroflexales bacterium]